jgi:TonB family protein
VIRILFLLGSVMFAAGAADVNGLLNAARSAEAAHRFDQAEDAYNAAFELAISKDLKRLSPAALELAMFYSRQRTPEKAEGVLKRALDAEEAAGQSPPLEIPVLMQLQDVYQRQRRNVDLAPVQTRLVKAWESLAGPDSVVVANNVYRLAGTLEQTGQFAESEEAIQRAIAIFEKTYGGNAPAVGYALGRLASVESKLGKDDLAKETRDRESTIRGKPARKPPASAVVSVPHLISQHEPKYSEKARKKRIQGTAILSLNVNTKGEPEDITVLLPLGDGLDEAAVEAVRTWRFQPGTKDGQPVPVQATIEVNFRLL